MSSGIPKIPPAIVAAPKGCFRVTVLNNEGVGYSVIFRFSQFETGLRMVEKHVIRNFPKKPTPGNVIQMLRPMIDTASEFETGPLTLCQTALWIACCNPDFSMRSAVEHTIRVLGRAALLVEENKEGKWEFLLGEEVGSNEQQPYSHVH